MSFPRGKPASGEKRMKIRPLSLRFEKGAVDSSTASGTISGRIARRSEEIGSADDRSGRAIDSREATVGGMQSV